VNTIVNTVNINAYGLSYKKLNDSLRDCLFGDAENIVLTNVYGHRYIGTRLFSENNFSENNKRLNIEIFGTPGNDLGAFLDKHRIIVHGNAQDGVGNTMNSGEIVVFGRAGDIVGMSMRGGKIFIRDSVGYRAAIHMKGYQDNKPVIIIGGTAQDFLGEYMAGGVVVMLGIDHKQHKTRFIGSGIHGGVIYIRGDVKEDQLSKDVGIFELDDGDKRELRIYIEEYTDKFKIRFREGAEEDFIKLLPISQNPYNQLYTH